MADEHEVITLSLRRSEAMTLAMLPHIAFLAGHGVSSVIEVLAVHATLGAVEVPFSLVFLIFLKIPLKLLPLSFHLAFRDTFCVRSVCVF